MNRRERGISAAAREVALIGVRGGATSSAGRQPGVVRCVSR